MREVMGATALLAAVMAVFLFRCEGPRPAIRNVRLEREGAGWRVGTELVNEGHGDGQVEVTFRLRELATGRTWQAERRVALAPHERVEVSEPVDAPEAADGRYAAEVEAKYPPR